MPTYKRRKMSFLPKKKRLKDAIGPFKIDDTKRVFSDFRE
jgi:hypothetical protein